MQENQTKPDSQANAQAEDSKRSRRKKLLRRSDQATIACFIAIGLIGLTCWVIRIGGSGEAVELDRATQRQASFRIDMNHAEWVEWAELPGLGESVARRVIESRETEGPFTSPEDLMRVKGIGPKTLEKIRPYLLPEPATQNMVGSP